MRSKITLFINAFRYRFLASAIALLFLFSLLGLILFERLNGEQIAIVVFLFATLFLVFHHVFCNFVQINMKSERLIIRDGFFGEKVLDKPLDDMKKIRIDRAKSSEFDGKYFIFIEYFNAHKQAILIEPKIKFRLSRYKPSPTEEQYRSHEKDFIEFESTCNLILKEYQSYRSGRNAAETE